MLIIAQPKSASTSLLKSLATIGNVKYKNGESRPKGFEYCEGFEELQKYHTTTHRRTKEYLQKWATRRDCILKEHILPTREHINALKNRKVIILLRNPDHSIDNYARMVEKFDHGEMSNKEAKELKLTEFKKLDVDKFGRDILLFNREWHKAKIGMIIDYDENSSIL